MRSGFSVPLLKGKINLFYFLAFMPLVLIVYFKFLSGYSILGVLIPFYGFLILFLKRDKLSSLPDAGGMQRFIGIITVLFSFFLYYLLIRFWPAISYGTGAVFYAMYIFGLFLAFFFISALKESLSAVFLVAAGGSSFHVGEWLEFYMEPMVPFFVRIFGFVLVLLGIPGTVHNPNMILLNTAKGPVPVYFAAGCIGIYSFLVFSVIVVVTMLEDVASVQTKLLWSVGGVIGTFLVNIVRVSFIAVVIYYFGYENWGEIHAWIGYALFLLWLMLFFVLFSKREAIPSKIRAFWQKL